MKKLILASALALLIGFGFTSCKTGYVPTPINAPMFQEKGQFAISRKLALVEAATRTRNGSHLSWAIRKAGCREAGSSPASVPTLGPNLNRQASSQPGIQRANASFQFLDPTGASRDFETLGPVRDFSGRIGPG